MSLKNKIGDIIETFEDVDVDIHEGFRLTITDRKSGELLAEVLLSEEET